MRTLAPLLLLALHPLHAQWAVSHSDPDRAWQDIQFIDDQTGYVVGNVLSTNNAVLLTTTDGGLTWSESLLPILSHAQRLSFLDADTGYLVTGGEPVRLLRTTNGGASWQGHTLDSCFLVMGMDLLDGNTAIYMNNEGRLRRFTNGGANFTYIANDLASWGLVDATDAQTAYLVEGDHFLRTGDGGLTWTAQPAGPASGALPSAFAFTDTQHGFASADISAGPNIHRTTDGGTTWQLSGTANAWVLAARGSACLAAAADASTITWTPDDGATWITDTAPATFAYPQGGELTPDHHAFLISDGVVYKRGSPLALGIADAAASTWTLAPNPATDVVRISGPWNGPLRVELIDPLGRTVLRTTTLGTLDLSTLPAGSYLLRIGTEAGVFLGRLVKA